MRLLARVNCGLVLNALYMRLVSDEVMGFRGRYSCAAINTMLPYSTSIDIL